MRLYQRARGLHARRRVHPRRVRRARLLGRGRFCAHGLAGAGGMGKLMAEWIVEGVPSLDVWHMDIRRFGRHYRSRRTRSRARVEVYSTYYDVKYPGEERAGRPAASVSPAYAAAGARGRVRREGGLGARRTGSSRTRRARRRSLRPRGWAGGSGRPAIGAEHRPPRGGRALRRDVLREDRGVGAGAALPGAPLRQPVDERRRPRSRTRRCSIARRDRVRLHRDPPRGERFRIVTGTAFGIHDLGVDPPHAAGRRLRRRRGRHVALGLLRPLGATRARLLQLSRSRPLERGLPVPEAREIAVGDVPCLALRVTYVGELGWELYCPTEFGLALWDALWEAGGPTVWSRAATGRSTPCAWRRATASGAPTSRPTSTPYEAGLGFAVKLDKGEFLGREALAPPSAPKVFGAGSRCLTLADPPPSRSPASRSGSTARWRPGHVTAASAIRSADRSPTGTCPPTPSPGTPVESSSSATRCPARSPPSRSTTPRAPRSVLDSNLHESG